MNQIKVKRIASDINKALCEIILEDGQDELLKEITITGCDVTNDLSFCKVYFTSLKDNNIKSLEKELNDNTSDYLRKMLADKIDIRHTPKLIFKYDNSIAYGNKIEKIIADLNSGKNNGN